MNLSFLRKGEERLTKSHKSPGEAFYILRDIFSCTPWELVVGKRDIDEDVFKTLISLRECNIPLPYLTQKVDFYGLSLTLKPGVFIPRPETETLVEVVLKKVSSIKGRKNILDVGAGSGAISLALASKLKDVFIIGTEIDELSLEVAWKNARRLSLEKRCLFLHADLFPKERISFDIIVSNPPYIPSWQIPFLPREVSLFEPRKSLDGGKDGLLFYHRIVEKAPLYLKKGGFVAVEVGQGESLEVAKIFSSCFRSIEIYPDLSGVERVVVAS